MGNWKRRIRNIIQFPKINPEIVCDRTSDISFECFMGGNSTARITWDGITLTRCDANSETGTYNGDGTITWDKDIIRKGYSFQWIKEGNQNIIYHKY